MRLETGRLILREYTDRDWYDVLAYQSDPRYLRFYPGTERTPADVRTFVSQFAGWARVSPRIKFQLAVVLRDSERLIGSCGIRKDQTGDREAELGYEIAPDFWGRGLATEAAKAMAAWGFRELDLHRIFGMCLAENAASARVLEKVDMRLEGRLRETRWIKGRWHDTLVYGLLAREWAEERGQEREMTA